MGTYQPTKETTKPSLAEAIKAAFKQTEYIQRPDEVLVIEKALGGGCNVSLFIERGMAFGLLAKGMNLSPEVETYSFNNSETGAFESRTLTRIFVQIDAAAETYPLAPSCMILFKDLESQKYYTGVASDAIFTPDNDSKDGMTEAEAYMKMLHHCIDFANYDRKKRLPLMDVIYSKHLSEPSVIYRAGKAVVDGVLTYFQRSPT